LKVFKKKISISQVLVVFQSSSSYCLWVEIWQFWANFAIYAVAKSIPDKRLKSLKPSNSSTMNPKAIWNGSLKSCQPYLLLQKVSKNPNIYCIYSIYPKMQKAILVALEL
jgi:hypothetical protein